MKLSLRWVCDHLKIDWKKINVDKLVQKFNTTVAEIEEYHKYSLDLKFFALAKLVTKNGDIECPEWKLTITLPSRNDAQEGRWYLVKKSEKNVVWATPGDFGCPKDGFLPAFTCTEKDAKSGSWKKAIEVEDYILDVDNKSITHRPDLWSHRGFARELAALLNTQFLPESKFLTKIALSSADKKFKATKEVPFSVSIEAASCKRFAVLYIDSVRYEPSALWMATRLMRVENRAIDLFVDATNYVMLDMGQPLHAFDADTIKTKTIEPRLAKAGEKLELLDTTQLTLTKEDLIITDGKSPLALGGIKGGLATGVTPQTKAILLESANFDPGVVRLTAARHKVRTEASARFEKALDPNQNVLGIMRFIKLLQVEGANISYTPKIVSLGAVAKSPTIKVSHEFIEDKLGLEIKKSFIKDTLQALGFEVKEAKGVYTVIVPTYRATKDIAIQEDIVEEVGRYLGYTSIPAVLPHIKADPEKESPVDRIDFIKQLLASTGYMHEVQNYAFFDNEFLKQINWKLNRPVGLANPLSEQRTVLATCLVPGLLQNVQENKADYDTLRFFEWGRVWRTDAKNKNKVDEHQILGGIFYKKKGEVDFYECKAILENFFASLNMDVTWQKAKKPAQWASLHQTADLHCNGKNFGSAGKVSKSKLAALGGGDAFVFEVCGDFLRDYKPKEKKFLDLPKYQATSLDISVIVSSATTVAELERAIAKADKRIFAVVLKDVFVKDDWENKKSVTLRFFVRDTSKTLQKDEIDSIHAFVEKALKQYGADVR